MSVQISDDILDKAYQAAKDLRAEGAYSGSGLPATKPTVTPTVTMGPGAPVPLYSSSEFDEWWRASTPHQLPPMPRAHAPAPRKDHTMLIVAGVAGAAALGMIVYFMVRKKPRAAMAGLRRGRQKRR